MNDIKQMANNLAKHTAEYNGIDVQEVSTLDSGLMQTKTEYNTAIQVVKPRRLTEVINRCVEEAVHGGDLFYYSWSQGGEIVEGATVGAALSIIRNFGNCAVETKVMETPSAYIFYGSVIDLETGFTLTRPFRKEKVSPKNKRGEDIYKGERGRDIIFQIGASKCIRNVILNFVPKFLVDKVVATAKQGIKTQIEKMGKVKAIEKIKHKAEALGIPLVRIETNYGKSEKWDVDRIVMVMGALRSVEDGVESIDDVFADKIPTNGEPKPKEKQHENIDKETGEILAVENQDASPVKKGK